MFSCTSLPAMGKTSLLLLPIIISAASAKTRPCAQNDYVCTQQLCEIYDGATTDSGTYLYGTDQWGADGSGSQCIYVELDDDTTHYASFNATWSWSNNSDWVHAYPNVQYESIQLPTTLSNIQSLQVNASWSIWPTASYSVDTDTAALTAIDAKCDIALDMFLDADATTASNASAAEIEVMVWGGFWGGVWPIGYYEPTTGAPNHTIDGITFQLFVGENQQGQKQTVYTWVPVTNVDAYSVDVSQLIDVIVASGNLTDSLYIGVIQFGSEAVHSEANVTTEFKSVYIDMEVKSSKTSSKSSSTATGTSTAKSAGFGHAMMPTITSFAYPVAMGAAAYLAM